MNIENSLISTALLALQAAGQLEFRTKYKTLPTGFHKTIEQDESFGKLGKFRLTIYMDKKSPTGYTIRVEAVAELPGLLLTDHHLESFEEFEDLIDKDYSIVAHKATRRRQLSK
jgi:hypothetical protein